MENKPNLSKIFTLQKVSLGLALSFYAVYKFLLKDPEIIHNLGNWYPVVLQVWTLVMLFSAGMSGWQLLAYIPDTKGLLKKKKEDE